MLKIIYVVITLFGVMMMLAAFALASQVKEYTALELIVMAVVSMFVAKFLKVVDEFEGTKKLEEKEDGTHNS